MCECHQGFTLTQNASWGFFLCSMPPTYGTVNQPHYIEMSCRGVISSKRPVITLDFILLKESSLVSAVGLGPEINFWACLRVLVRFRHTVICWLSVQRFVLVICLETPKAGSGPANWWTFPSLASPSAVSLPHPRMSGVPEEPHRIVGENVVQRVLALLLQWGRCFGRLRSFQSRLSGLRTD